MRPTDMQTIGQELAVKWDDGTESFIRLETLRRYCPCAACMGEQDVFGNVYKAPERPYGSRAFEVVQLRPVGGYAVQPVWGDGHQHGLYTWEWLRSVEVADRPSPGGVH